MEPQIPPTWMVLTPREERRLAYEIRHPGETPPSWDDEGPEQLYPPTVLLEGELLEMDAVADTPPTIAAPITREAVTPVIIRPSKFTRHPRARAQGQPAIPRVAWVVPGAKKAAPKKPAVMGKPSSIEACIRALHDIMAARQQLCKVVDLVEVARSKK